MTKIIEVYMYRWRKPLRYKYIFFIFFKFTFILKTRKIFFFFRRLEDYRLYNTLSLFSFVLFEVAFFNKGLSTFIF